VAILVSLWASCAYGQTDLEKQIIACGSLSTCTITIPSGVNVVTAPWDLRDKKAIKIIGDGSSVVIWWFPTDHAPGVCMDTTGTANLVVENVTFALGNSSDVPGALWVHARGSDSRSQRGFYVSNVKFEGRGKKALVAVIALENDVWQSVGFINGWPNTPSLFMSRANEIDVVSPFGTVPVNITTATCTNHNFINCSFDHAGHERVVPPANNNRACGVTLGTGVHDWWAQGGSSSQGPRDAVLCVSGSGNRRIAAIAPNWEAESALATIHVLAGAEVKALSVDHGLMQAAGPAVQNDGTIEGIELRPAEMLTSSLIQFGPNAKLTGGMVANGFTGQ